MKKLNWTAIATYVTIVSISSIFFYWSFRVLYFFYLLIKALI